MPINCFYCGSKREAGSSRTFHRWPYKDPEILQAWLKAMKLNVWFQPKTWQRLCSDHFDSETCFKISGQKRYLLKESIPTRFEQSPIYCALCKTIKGEDKRSFWRFPIKNPNVLNKWVAVINDSHRTPLENSYLCSKHFKPSCFRYNDASAKHLRLRDDAIPTYLDTAKYTNSQESNKTNRSFAVDTIFNNTKPLDNECIENIENQDEASTRRTVENISYIENNVIENIVSDSKEFEIVQEYVLQSVIQDNCSGMKVEANLALSSASNKSSINVDTIPSNFVVSRRYASHLPSLEHDHSYHNKFRTPEQNSLVKGLRNRIRVQQQTIRRMSIRINTLKKQIKDLRKKAMISK